MRQIHHLKNTGEFHGFCQGPYMVGDLHVVVPLSPFLTVDSIFGVVVPDSGRCWRICALFSGLMARFV